MQERLPKLLLSLPGVRIEDWSDTKGMVWVEADQIRTVMQELLAQPGTPVVLTHVTNDERSLGKGFVIYVLLHFLPDFELMLGVGGIERDFPSLTPIAQVFNWSEREAQDLFGLRAVGHPDPRPLVLHPGWPKDFHPLQKETDLTRKPEFKRQPLELPEAQGEGIFEIPVGPIHAGIIEPGHFRFQTIGEVVAHLEAQLFYTHKGAEKLLEGQDIGLGLKFIERLCGVCTVSHTLAYCEAVENLAGLKLPRGVLLWRTVLAELERLYNHMGDLGNICAGVGFALGNANALQTKERLQRLNQEVFGHRFLRGVVIPGGIRIIPDEEKEKYLSNRLQEVTRDFEGWIPLLLEHNDFRQRAISTGILEREVAVDFGVTGPAARASGLSCDWRQRHPYLLYPEVKVEPVVETGGDVWARFMVRVNEVRESLRMIVELVKNEVEEDKGKEVEPLLTQQVSSLDSKKLPPFKIAWGAAESPRGTTVVWLMTDEEGKIYRCRIRSASYFNWPAVPLAVLGNIVPDFPLINKSFELCYSCCDR